MEVLWRLPQHQRNAPTRGEQALARGEAMDPAVSDIETLQAPHRASTSVAAKQPRKQVSATNVDTFSRLFHTAFSIVRKLDEELDAILDEILG